MGWGTQTLCRRSMWTYIHIRYLYPPPFASRIKLYTREIQIHFLRNVHTNYVVFVFLYNGTAVGESAAAGGIVLVLALFCSSTQTIWSVNTNSDSVEIKKKKLILLHELRILVWLYQREGMNVVSHFGNMELLHRRASA